MKKQLFGITEFETGFIAFIETEDENILNKYCLWIDSETEFMKIDYLTKDNYSDKYDYKLIVAITDNLRSKHGNVNCAVLDIHPYGPSYTMLEKCYYEAPLDFIGTGSSAYAEEEEMRWHDNFEEALAGIRESIGHFELPSNNIYMPVEWKDRQMVGCKAIKLKENLYLNIQCDDKYRVIHWKFFE